MAFVDGSSAGNLSGMRWAAYGAVSTVEVIAVSPAAGNRIPSTAVPLAAIVTNTGTGGSDVQFQVATDAAFASVVAAPSTSAAPNGLPCTGGPGAPTRAPRAGDPGARPSTSRST
jgi:hypothetical protein